MLESWRKLGMNFGGSAGQMGNAHIRPFTTTGARPTTKDKAAIVCFGAPKLYTDCIWVHTVVSPSPMHSFPISPHCFRTQAPLEEEKL